jgi:hypothetical protein
MNLPEINLDVLDNGALMEQAGAELRKIFANIADPNIPQGAKRKLQISIVIKPNEKSGMAEIGYDVKTTMPGPAGGRTMAYIAQGHDNRLALFQVPPSGGQPPLFEEKENVRPLGAKEA